MITLIVSSISNIILEWWTMFKQTNLLYIKALIIYSVRLTVVTLTVKEATFNVIFEFLQEILD